MKQTLRKAVGEENSKWPGNIELSSEVSYCSRLESMLGIPGQFRLLFDIARSKAVRLYRNHLAHLQEDFKVELQCTRRERKLVVLQHRRMQNAELANDTVLAFSVEMDARCMTWQVRPI